MHVQKLVAVIARKLTKKGFQVEIFEDEKKGVFLTVQKKGGRFVTHHVLDTCRQEIEKGSRTVVRLANSNGSGKIVLVVR